ncbi:hypothetical protein Z043_111478 [Scleropages formosus]|uniref:Insulin-like domain-containing protein n=1 Tax=Scleropages formosus TaxID=113540 RepID=A0A0P7V9C5_SCLFO|nr:hypothetical protein Z043_111478 [Scleropages formosus]
MKLLRPTGPPGYEPVPCNRAAQVPTSRWPRLPLARPHDSKTRSSLRLPRSRLRAVRRPVPAWRFERSGCVRLERDRKKRARPRNLTGTQRGPSAVEEAGKAATSRGGTRLRGKGIVEQCCLRGCDLLDLEAYCAKPRRSRRFAPAAAPPPQATEDVNMAELRRRTGRPPKPVAAAHDGSAPQESLATLPRRGLGKARRGARWGR